jgi:diacylglycerol O-acyltransferase
MTKTKGTTEVKNILDLADQALFLGERATGVTSVIQCIWVYDRAIDIDGLQRFHHHLQRGRLARRIERSPLPFGRHRWVMGSDSSDIEYIQTPRPREEFDDWLTDQAHTPLDAEHGPGWHLGVVKFTDGGTGVSLVVAHSLIDGVGLAMAVVEATSGVDDAIMWPPAGSRRRWRALREDARQSARDIPAVGRAARVAIRMARRRCGDGSASARASKQVESSDETIALPSATAFIDASEWDARAQSLGGTSNALLAGLAADVAQRMTRVAAHGAVMLSIPVNERTDGDTRANAVTNVDVTVDPTDATTDLRGIRAAIKQALINHNAVPDERLALLPIVPLVPKRLMRRMVSVATGNAASVVSSNLGAVPPAVTRPDGTDADYCTARSVYPGMTRATMHRTGGVLGFISGRVNGKVGISVLSYQPGRPNSDAELRQTLSRTFAAFSLNATMQWEPSELAQPTGVFQ